MGAASEKVDVYVTPEQALEVAQLTRRGNAYYADRRADGVAHDEAFADAVYSYGRREC